MLEPKDVLYEAIKAELPKIIIVHNHPSGDCTPSKSDINITRRIVASAEMLGLQVLDHIIIADKRMRKRNETFELKLNDKQVKSLINQTCEIALERNEIKNGFI